MSGVRIGRALRGKMRLGVTVALALLLVIVVCVWFFIRAQRLEAESPHTIEVYMDDLLAGRADREWFAALEPIRVEIRGEEITCVSLIDLLDSMDARPTLRETITVDGADGPVSVRAKDVLAQWSAYIVYEADGKPLASENGGPYRLMVMKADGTVVSVDAVRRITIELME